MCKKSVLAILLAMSMVLAPASTAYAASDISLDNADCPETVCDGSEEGVQTLSLTETKATHADGTYPVKSWSFTRENGTSRRTFTMKDTLEVKSGVAYVTLTVDSTSYTYALVDGKQYDCTISGSNATFTIPTSFGKDEKVSMFSTTMGAVPFVLNVEGDFSSEGALGTPGATTPTPTPTPDTSTKPDPTPTPDPTPAPTTVADGKYRAEVTTNATMFKVVDAILTVDKGSMSVLLTLSGTGYDCLYLGTKEEAAAAAESDYYKAIGTVEYDDNGTKKTGAQFEIPVSSLDQDIKVASRSASNKSWFSRTLRVKSGTLTRYTTWQDGTYTGKGSVPDGKYPTYGYEFDVKVEIKDDKITKIYYGEEPANDGNITYKKWAMEGHYLYDEKTKTWSFVKGIAEQVIGKNSTTGVDVVSRATKCSNGLIDGINAALKKAETGDKDTTGSTTPPADTPTTVKIADTGVYDVEVDCNGLSVVESKLISKYGKMYAQITLSGTGTDILYFSSKSFMEAEAEAKDAGENALVMPYATKPYVNASGVTKNGYAFEIPVESLDRDIRFISHAASSDCWFYRTICFKSASLSKTGMPEMTWQDGNYTGKGQVTTVEGSYFKNNYEVDITVTIKDGKITAVNYADEIASDNGNISYMKWAMDGCYIYKEGETDTVLKGVGTQIVEANSADKIDVVSGATRISLGIQEGAWNALKKAEKGDKDPEKTPDTTPVAPNKIADEGEYTVTAKANGITVIETKLTSKDGKMTALVTLSGTGYDYLYFGTEYEAKAAGISNWYKYVGSKDYVNAKGQNKTGYQFLIPVESLDKEIKLVTHTAYTGKWFYRTLEFDSSTLAAINTPDEPGTDAPGTDTDKPGTDADKPSTDTDKPGTDNPGTDADKPSTDKPSTDKPSTDKPSTDKPSTDKPSTDKPSTDKPSTDKPSTDKPSTDKPSTDKPSTDKPSTDKPSTNKPSGTQTGTSNGVKTGDTTGYVVVWAILCGISLFGAVIIVMKKRHSHI